MQWAAGGISPPADRLLPTEDFTMNRLLSTIRCDITLQLRNGFYAATIFVTLLWALILFQIGTLDLRWLLPPLVVGNLMVGTFSFIGGLVLLERGEGSLTAQVVTPLRISEYLTSKVVTLALLAVVETLVIVLLMAGWRFNALLLIVGAALAAAIYCLAGFIAVARYDSINEYLLPSGMYVAALWIPLIAYIGQSRPWILYLHPLFAPLLLVEASFVTLTWWQIAYGIGYSLAWVILLYLASRFAFRRWMIER
jgi:fluoroquinolone transport system permease protein